MSNTDQAISKKILNEVVDDVVDPEVVDPAVSRKILSDVVDPAVSRKILSDIVVYSKYARYIPDQKRRESWEEIVWRNANMHINKFPSFQEEILQAYQYVLDRQVLPSMRALEDSTPIRTGDGWKTAGTIVKGDLLFDSSGHLTEVKEVIKFIDKDLYTLKFSDKSELTACDEHLWIVSTEDDRHFGKTRVVDTKFIREHLKQGEKNNISIANPSPVEFTIQDVLELDPYILGHWLGDGYSSGYQYSCSVEDSEFIAKQYAKYSPKQSTSSNIWTWNVHGLSKDLRKYDLINNKHIPWEYLDSSIESRLSLLQGLMDSNGYITKEGICLFSNTNITLIDNVKELLSSLGITHTTTISKPKEYTNHLPIYTIKFTTTLKVARLPRKVERLRTDKLKQTEHRKVIEVVYKGKGNATCFHVDSPDHSFLAGKEMIVTHNSLQFGGKPIEISPNRLFNCFSRETEFITDKGTKSFNDFNDGDTVTVPTHENTFRLATVHNYGKQRLNKIVFRRGKSSKTVYATPEHRWIKFDGYDTTDLRVGDIIYPSQMYDQQFDYDSAGPMAKLYWCYGFVYGDGTIVKSGDTKYSMVRLCGNDVKYLPRFLEMGFSSSEPNSCNGDMFVYTGKYQKTAPDFSKESLDMIRAFMDGYLSAAAHKNPDWYENQYLSKYISIQASDEDHINFLKKGLELCGYFITNVQDLTGQETNFGILPETYKFSITTRIGSRENTAWVVHSIEETDRFEDVWCLSVQDHHSFILSGGIVTGNCAYMPVDNHAAFSETMFLLLGGTGVGYSVQKHHVEKLPEILGPKKRNRRYLIGDSIEGWSDAVKVLVEAYYFNKADPIYDFRDIRPKGALLVTSGGKAPGPQPLKDCLHNIRKVFDRALERGTGTQLTTLEVHDIICYIADTVLAGGIRRAALISLFSFDDEDMLTCKFGNWWELNPQRARANNSAVALRHRIKKKDFFEFWEKVKASGCGEPGIYFTNDKEWGCNPCVTGDTWIQTSDGASQVKDLIAKPFNAVVNGVIYQSNGFWSTGVKQVYELRTKRGYKIKLTDNHKLLRYNHQEEADNWTELKNLKVGEDICLSSHELRRDYPYHYDINQVELGWLLGYLVGNGTFGHDSACLDYWGESAPYLSNYSLDIIKNQLKHRSDLGIAACVQEGKLRISSTGLRDLASRYGIIQGNKTITDQIEKAPKWFKLGFLRGLFDADGGVQGTQSKGVSVRLNQSDLKLLERAQRMLSSIGIISTIYPRQEAGFKLLPDGNGGMKYYPTKDNYELVISGQALCVYDYWIGFEDPFKKLKLSGLLAQYQRTLNQQTFFDKIESITYLGEEEVYDCTVEGAHEFCANGIRAHNCVEIGLRPNQFCNLTTVNVSDVESQEDLNNRVRAAARIATLQATYTEFHYLRDIWQKTTEKEALIGVSMTGIASGAVLKLNLEEAANVVKEENQRVAKILGINPAARTTCIKPEGTASLVVGSSSGIHAWHSPYYIRRMRIGKNEAIYKYLKKTIPDLLEDEMLKPDLEAVLSIPIKAPEGSIFRTETAIDLLERGKLFSTKWITPGHISGSNQHNVSITVSVKDNEWDEVGAWMWENRKLYNGIAVLPYDGGNYVQKPYEDCTKEQYEELLAKCRSINLMDVVEDDDYTSLKEEAACAGGACTITKV